MRIGERILDIDYQENTEMKTIIEIISDKQIFTTGSKAYIQIVFKTIKILNPYSKRLKVL